MATIYAPIYKDVYYTGTTDEFEYYITLDGEEIYRGRAFIAPDAETFRINISKVCQDYLSSSLPDFRTMSGGTISHTEAFRTFNLYRGSNDTLLNSYNFLYCWDYKTLFSTNSRTVLSHPINGHYCPNMKVFSTVYASNAVSTTLTTGSGTSCGSGALYYLNRSGGWDSFLIEGSVKRTDSYDKYSFNTSFDNNTIEFEEGTYNNQITSSWVLHTGYLTDEESKNLAFNLIPSNQVYFQDFESGAVVPVVITNSNTDYKTYKGNNRKLVRYDIQIRESQKKQML